jgi:transaldolase
MKMTRMLHEPGQSIWLDDITRDLLNDGALRRCIEKARAA